MCIDFARLCSCCERNIVSFLLLEIIGKEHFCFPASLTQTYILPFQVCFSDLQATTASLFLFSFLPTLWENLPFIELISASNTL